MAPLNIRLLTPGQVAKLLQVAPQTVARWNRLGRIDAVRTPGGHRRYRETDVHALLKAWPVPAY